MFYLGMFDHCNNYRPQSLPLLNSDDAKNFENDGIYFAKNSSNFPAKEDAHLSSVDQLLTPISNALSISFEKKCTKITNLLEKHMEKAEQFMDSFRGFALSTGGLIKDEYRQKIWPILAKNIPQTEHCPFAESCSQSLYTNTHEQDDTDRNASNNDPIIAETDLLNHTDSEFESAMSNFSSSLTIDTDHEDEFDEVDNDILAINSLLSVPTETLQKHSEWNQVQLDVARTLARFPPELETDQREILQEKLTELIVRILYERSDYRYYQGFHDVCLTFLLVLGDEAFPVIRYICQRGSFHNYLLYTLEESVLYELDNLYVLLFLHDYEVEKRMREAELGTLFALSWPLTWFSHALHHYSQIVLFFDFLLCSHHLMPIYISAALVSERRGEILDCEPEMPLLHKLLNEIPSKMNCYRILDTARILYGRYPPAVLIELRKEYLQMCERQHRQKNVLEKLEFAQQQTTKGLKERRSSLRLNVYEVVKPFAVCSSIAALAVAYYYIQRTSSLF